MERVEQIEKKVKRKLKQNKIKFKWILENMQKLSEPLDRK